MADAGAAPELNSLSVADDRSPVVRDLTLTVRNGEVAALLGSHWHHQPVQPSLLVKRALSCPFCPALGVRFTDNDAVHRQRRGTPPPALAKTIYHDKYLYLSISDIRRGPGFGR